MRRWLTSGLALALSGCLPDAPLDSVPERSEFRLTGVEMRYFHGSERAAVATARTAVLRHGSDEVSAIGMDLLLEGRRAGEAVRVTATDVTGELSSGRARATGGVTVSDEKGLRGATPAARFSQRERRASGSEPVEVWGDGFRLEAAQGFSLDTSPGGSLVLDGPVSAVGTEQR